MPNNTLPLAKTPKNQMQKVLIDLTGQGGLYSRFYGDYAYSVPHPELAVFGAPEQYASGIVNPVAKAGYISPANTTFSTCVTTSVASDDIVTCNVVDEQNDIALFFTADGIIHRTISLTDISFTATTVTLPNSAVGTDMQFYSASGIRKLFFAYEETVGGTLQGDIGVWDLAGISGTTVNGTTLFMTYTTLTAKLHTGEKLTGGTSGATAHISANYNINSNGAGATGLLMLTNISGTFTGGEIITDTSSGSATALVSGTGAIYSSIVESFMSLYVATPGTSSGNQDGLLEGGSFTRMVVADNGYMYILDGSAVHKYDGTDGGGSSVINVSGVIPDSYQAFGIVTPTVLEFPAQFTLTDAIDLRGDLWITLFRSQRNLYTSGTDTEIFENYNGVYIWDRVTEGTSTTDFIEVPGVREIRAIVDFQDVATLFVVSSTMYTQIRMWNGTSFKTVCQLGQNACPRFHDSVSVNGDLMTWLGGDGQFYSYGKINPGVKSNSLYQIGDTTVKTTPSASFVFGGSILLCNSAQSSSTGLNAQPEGYYAGIQDSTNVKILKWYPHATNVNSAFQQAAPGNFYSMVMPLPKLSQTHYLTIFFPPIGSGGSTTLMNFNIYLNQSATPWNASPIPLTQNDAMRSYMTIPMHVHGVNFVQIGWSYPASTSISAIPTPSFGTVDYTATTQLI